eukprot:jgi/Ulvmu1/1374/UM011_0102.1
MLARCVCISATCSALNFEVLVRTCWNPSTCLRLKDSAEPAWLEPSSKLEQIHTLRLSSHASDHIHGISIIPSCQNRRDSTLVHTVCSQSARHPSQVQELHRMPAMHDRAARCGNAPFRQWPAAGMYTQVYMACKALSNSVLIVEALNLL